MNFGISESVAHWGRYRRDGPAVHYNSNIVTFAQLNSCIYALANSIDQLNLNVERIGIAVKSKYHFLVSLLSILRVGKSAVLLNTKLPLNAIRTNIEDTETQALLYDNNHNHILKLVGAKNKKNTINIEDRIYEIQSISDMSGRSASYISRMPKDEWGVLFSSGTTGVPKGIVRDHYSIVIEMLGWCIELGLNKETSFYIGRPLFYTGGLILSLSTLLVGGSVFINDYKNDNDNNEVWKDYQKESSQYDIDWAFFIPDQMRRFNKISEKRKGKPFGAKTILVMGAPISAEEKVTSAKMLNSRVVESWGNSESLGTITEPEDIEFRPDSIGRPFLSDELYVVDDEGNVLAPGQYGRLAGGEEAGFNYYCNRPQETNHVKRNRLVISDDIGSMDKDGYFYIRGRDQDCILIDKVTVFLPEIETKLKKNENVEDCAIVPELVKGSDVELVCALVRSKKAPINTAHLLELLNKDLDPHESLKRLVILESLPRLPSGKVDKVEIKKLLSNKN